jgi:hypothetical protein
MAGKVGQDLREEAREKWENSERDIPFSQEEIREIQAFEEKLRAEEEAAAEEREKNAEESVSEKKGAAQLSGLAAAKAAAMAAAQTTTLGDADEIFDDVSRITMNTNMNANMNIILAVFRTGEADAYYYCNFGSSNFKEKNPN